MISTLRCRDARQPTGITSIRSAHPPVIDAGFRAARDNLALIEATCNQIN